MAQGEKLFADSAVAAVIKVDAEHADEAAVLLDVHGVGAQRLAVYRHAVIVQTVVLCLVTFVHQGAQSHVCQGSADLTAADMIVGNGDDGAVFIRQIMEGDFIVRTQCMT